MARHATQAKPSNPAPAPADAEVESLLGTMLTWAAFVLTLAICLARAMMSETLREPFEVIVGGSSAPRGPGPATTLLLDALGCVPALLVLIRRVVDRDYILRWHPSHRLLALLATWSAFSFAWSTDRFATAIAAANTIAMAALLWSTTQLVRSWLRVRIVAGLCLGLLLVYAASGLYYRFVQVPDNIRFWKEHKQQILDERGMEEDSYAARQFERKFIGGEMIGFNQSPNSFAAGIVMMLVVSAGVAISRGVARDPPAWWMTIAIACAPALLVLYLTHSRTSAGTLLIAAMLLVSLASSRVRGWLATHSKLAYGIGAGAILLGAAALIGHGVYHGSLPNDSLNFRWRYWTAAAKLIAMHPLSGVGWGNFGPHYLAVRVPAAAEEVRDPHNFIVRGFAELGVVGGLLIIAWMARLAWELTRPVMPQATPVPRATGGWAMPAGIAVAGVTLNAICSIDFSQSSAYLQLEIFYRIVYLALIGLGLFLATQRGGEGRELDARPAPWLLYAMIIAIAVFFLHAMMDFVLAETGAMTALAVVAGAALVLRTPSPAGAKRRSGVAIAGLTGGAIAWVVAVVSVAIPVVDAEQTAARADEALRHDDPARAGALFDAAYRTIPWNADYPSRSARALMLAGAPPEKVKAMLDLAIATDPATVSYLQSRAAYEMRLPSPDAEAVKRDYQKLLKLDPNNIAARIEFAEMLVKLGDPTGAAEQYREALRLNELLDPTEPERLTPQRVREIDDLVARLGKP